MRLICYPLGEIQPVIRPAPATRPWLDELPQAFAYRCLPLTIASSHGWELLCPGTFDATWNGGPAADDIQVTCLEGDASGAPMSHFANGILTFHVGYLFRTEPGFNLFVTGPINERKDGIMPLAGVIEADWAPYTFTMNWVFTRPGATVRFEKGEPFCFFFPVQRGLLETVEPEIRDLDSDPETKAEHEAWSASRHKFLKELPEPGSSSQLERWQKHYYRGLRPGGADGTEDHQIKLRLRPFKDSTQGRVPVSEPAQSAPASRAAAGASPGNEPEGGDDEPARGRPPQSVGAAGRVTAHAPDATASQARQGEEAAAEEAAPFSYDVVPYEGHAFPQTHPDNLATIASLFGMAPAPADRCRVLELGCADGGNIIPMAGNLPGAEFVGVDLSARQVEMGCEVIEALGLGNIRLLHQSIDDVGPELGRFDYVVAHGVYSWVPLATREKIVSICKQNLAADGVAYVSYNTYPGWHMPEAMREMMLYHVSSFKAPEMKTKQARALLAFLHEATAARSNAYSLFLKGEVDNLSRRRDTYIFHEFLEAVNHPVYFHEFAEQAARHGLQYLAEAHVSTMLVENFPEKIAAKLRLAGSIIRREQYMDFLFNRRFRSTLLCHADRRLTRRVPLKAVKDCWFTSLARPDPSDQDLDAAQRVTVARSGGGGRRSLPWRQPRKAALRVLWDRWPEPLSYDELTDEVARSLSAAGADAGSPEGQRPADPDQQLTSTLLGLYFLGVIDLHRCPPRMATRVGERPEVMPLARLQASRHNWATNQWHTAVVLNPFERALVQVLDGAHDRPALEAEMIKLIKKGKLVVDTSAADKEQTVKKVREGVGLSLERAARRALLVE